MPETRPSQPSKSVLITGCSTGIGRATAKLLAGQGWRVYASARRLDSVADLADSGCELLQLDVDDEASIEAAVATIEEDDGAVGVLVNNAGFSQSGAVEEVPMDRVRRQFETNVFGAVRLIQRVLPGMRRQGWGKIVNVSSMGGKLVFPGGGYYHAAKHALEAISDALRFEVQGFGIDVIVIEPGLITTEFGRTAAATVNSDSSDGAYAKFNEVVAEGTRDIYDSPMAKLGGPPESVAKAIAKAISKRRPRPRYKVTPSARLALLGRRLVSDRMWDRAMRAQFPVPGKR
jgi:NAD(P)-dependent dehydrogenase (short-subunit alcohol dehydrogenase family)